MLLNFFNSLKIIKNTFFRNMDWMTDGEVMRYSNPLLAVY